MAPSRAMNGFPSPNSTQDPSPPTVASFSPASSNTSTAKRQRSASTILVRQKSPLLIATPPQVTRTLAFSHPFILPLNKVVGLVTWTSGDPWQSFLLVATFWATALYGDVIIQCIGPVMVVVGLIAGMYLRRYSPLSSTGWTGEKQKSHKREPSEGSMRHQKSLDEIVSTLTVFTSRCNVLLEPLLQLTDFLSTQQTATSATTRPALTTLFIRILLITPVWVVLSLPPLYIITSRRVILAFGTLLLSWHSRPARVCRTILWRSLTVRNIVSAVTGLTFTDAPPPVPTRKCAPPPLPPRSKNRQDMTTSSAAGSMGESSGVRFTFVVFENQRRWLGLGWTPNMLAYERSSWTDEQLNQSRDKDKFELPEVEGEDAGWRWVNGSEWQVEAAGKGNSGDGWIYYDNKWNDGRRDQDGWGRYTRRRKWYRDAELVELSADDMKSDSGSHNTEIDESALIPADAPPDYSQAIKDTDAASSNKSSKKGFLRSSSNSGRITLSSDDESILHPLPSHEERNEDWGIGDDLKMGLG